MSPEELAEETGFTLAYVARLLSIRRKIYSIDQALDADAALVEKGVLQASVYAYQFQPHDGEGFEREGVMELDEYPEDRTEQRLERHVAPAIRRQLQDEFIKLSAVMKKTTVFITHDLDEAVRVGDRIAIIIVSTDTPLAKAALEADKVAQAGLEHLHRSRDRRQCTAR